jgi:hypothetical protein
MADFKIKPTAGTGNKLILESEDGTDVLTTSASGVTLASATLTSPTLNSPTLVTPAITGNATASGNLTVSGDIVPSTPLSHRNMIINGGMQIAQRSTSTVAQADASNEGYATLDRWHLQFASGCPGTVTTSRSTDAPDGFRSSMKLDCTSTGTPVDTTNDYIRLWTKLEGQDLQRLSFGNSSAKSMTLSWYMKSVSFVEPISIHFLAYGSPANEYYNVTVTPTTSWARYSVTVPGSTSLSFANDNTQGLNIGFTVAGPATPQHTQASNSTSWSTTTSNAVTDIGNLVDDTANELFITGVQLELGSNATPFEHRSYGDELARCKRYYTIIPTQKAFPALGDGTTNGVISFYLPVPMRTTPAIKQINSVDHRIYRSGYVGSTSTHVTIDSIDADSTYLKCAFAGFSSISTQHTYQWLAVGSYQLGIDAEIF